MKKILHIFSSVVVFLIIIVLMLITGAQLLGVSPYKYSDGSIIYVKPTSDYSQLKEGDTITYVLNSEKLIATNVIFNVNTEKRFFYIKSADLLYVDPSHTESAIIINDTPVVPVSFDDLIGETITAIPYLGFVADFLATVDGIFISLGISIFFLLLSIITGPSRTVQGENHSVEKTNEKEPPILSATESADKKSTQLQNESDNTNTQNYIADSFEDDQPVKLEDKEYYLRRASQQNAEKLQKYASVKFDDNNKNVFEGKPIPKHDESNYNNKRLDLSRQNKKAHFHRFNRSVNDSESKASVSRRTQGK